MSVGVWLRFRGFVEDVEGTWSAVKGDEASFGGFGEQNVGQGVGEGVEKSKKGGDGRRGGFVRGDVDDARCQPWREVLGAMWNASAVEVLMLMRVREQEGADSWRSFRGVDDSIENWYSSCACSLEGVWAGISRGGSAKVLWLVIVRHVISVGRMYCALAFLRERARRHFVNSVYCGEIG